MYMSNTNTPCVYEFDYVFEYVYEFEYVFEYVYEFEYVFEYDYSSNLKRVCAQRMSA